MKIVFSTAVFLILSIVCGCSSTIARTRMMQHFWNEVVEGEDVESRLAAKPAIAPLLSSTSLEELVFFAWTNRPTVVSKRLAVEDERLALKQIRADAPILSSNPIGGVDVSASIGHAESSRSANSLRKKTDGNASGTLSLDLLLWDFGRNDARAKAQCEKVVSAERALYEEALSVFSETANAYFSLYEKLALFDVAVSNEFEYAEHLRRAETKLECGEGRKLDVLRARLDHATACESTVSASNDVAVAKAELLRALGAKSFGEEKRVKDALSSLRKGFGRSKATGAEILDSAMTNSPAMAIAHARFRASSAAVDEAIAELYPEISASIAFNWSDPLWYWRWGVSAVQSLFTGWRKTTAVDRAIVAMESAAADVDEAGKALALSVSVAVSERDTAIEALRTAETSVKEAAENLSTVKEQLEIGEADRVDFSQAASAYAKALGSRVKAFYRAQRAEASIFTISGEMPVYNEGRYEAK